MPDSIPSLALAYIGDAVFELYVRRGLVARRITRVQQLHREAVKLVRASSQAQFLRQIEPELTEEELAVMRRGRNARSGTAPKGAEMVEYRLSTGLECVFGFWYLRGELARLEAMLEKLPWPGQTDSTN